MGHSSDLERYSILDADGNGRDWMTEDYEEAKAEAFKIGGAVVAHTWTWSDSEIVEDFRADDAEEGA